MWNVQLKEKTEMLPKVSERLSHGNGRNLIMWKNVLVVEHPDGLQWEME